MRIEQSELLSQLDWLIHGFCSPGTDAVPNEDDFFAANCSYQCGDPEAVFAARQKACANLGLNAYDLVFVYQEHGTKVCQVSETHRGAGATPECERLGPADALSTDQPGVPLGILVADCLPVFVADRKRRRAGLIHSGWRGSHGDIVGGVLRQWIETGSSPEDLLVWIGPGIGFCCFEVGAEVLEAFAIDYPDWMDLLRDGVLNQNPPNGKNAMKSEHVPAGFVNLPELVQRQLLRCKLPPENIDIANQCTKCGSGYFSYRRDGAGKGHNMAVMAIR